MYTYNGFDSVAANAGSGIWTIISFIIAIAGAFIVYFMFVKSNQNYPNKFLNWLKSFLNFQEMLIEPILKITYIFVALLITLTSFATCLPYVPKAKSAFFGTL